MRKIKSVIFYGVTVLALVVIAASVLRPSRAYADSPSIIINEIMYHPRSEVDNDEFLEIYNTTSSTVDLTGWCFTAGITLCFADGTTIAGQSYAVVSPNAAQTLATYNVTTIGTYTGKLDNGGETITLRDNTSTIINSLTYDDVPPWPTTPDGSGPSLALKNPTMDNTQASSWGACPCGSSPGVANLLFTAGLPDILNVSTPQNVTASTAPTVTVNVTNADSVNLIYKVMFAAEQTVPMFDDGAHGDGAASDGTYGAVIPAQLAGKLVRYKVSATNPEGTQTKPGGSDTINYQGYVVQDPSVTSQLPILQWFMEDSVRDDMIANHSFDDQEFPAVIAHGNTVIDNARIHIKGQTTRGLVKKAFAVDLPKGYKLQFGDMSRPVDEFHLNSSYLDTSGVADIMSWRLAEAMGMPTTQMFKIRLQNNSSFYGLYTFAEEYDKSWREDFGYQDGSFYKGTVKKTRVDINDGTELQDWLSAVSDSTTETRINYAVNHQDVPNTLNLMAFNTFIRNWDVTFGKNWLSYHDINGNGRWKSLPYDLDSSFYGGSAWVAGQHFVTPYEMPGTYGEFNRGYRAPLLALYDDPMYRQSYFRRLRTLTDEYLLSGWMNDQYTELANSTEPEFTMDYEKWGSLTDPIYARKNITDVLKEMKFNLSKRFQKPWGLPSTQSVAPVVNVQDVSTNLGNSEDDYIELKNNTGEAIDMSKWYIPELNYTLPLGSVIAPEQTAYIVRNDPIFVSLHPNDYVIGQITQDIPSFANVTLKRANGSTADMWLMM